LICYFKDGVAMEGKKIEKLIEVLDNSFNEGELRTLAYDLNIHHDYFPSVSKSRRVREIVAFTDRRGRLDDLIAYVRDLRPDAFQSTPAIQSSTDFNIGKVGINGSVSIGSSIHTNNINIDNTKVALSSSEDRERINELLTKLQKIIKRSSQDSIEERELLYALENIKTIEKEINSPKPRPNLLLHQLKDTDRILETVATRPKTRGRLFENISIAIDISKELYQLTMKLL